MTKADVYTYLFHRIVGTRTKATRSGDDFLSETLPTGGIQRWGPNTFLLHLQVRVESGKVLTHSEAASRDLKSVKLLKVMGSEKKTPTDRLTH